MFERDWARSTLLLLLLMCLYHFSCHISSNFPNTFFNRCPIKNIDIFSLPFFISWENSLRIRSKNVKEMKLLLFLQPHTMNWHVPARKNIQVFSQRYLFDMSKWDKKMGEIKQHAEGNWGSITYFIFRYYLAKKCVFLEIMGVVFVRKHSYVCYTASMKTIRIFRSNILNRVELPSNRAWK